MNGVLDHLLVGLVLLASLGYAVYSLGPRTWRGSLLAATSALLLRLPTCFGLRAVAQRMAAVKAKGACGGCDNCGSEQPPAPSPEVRIPLAKIGKRRRARARA